MEAANMDEILEQVRSFAAKAHEGQERKYADEPYINHPVRVMEICRKYTDDVTVLAAALLHDVLEDTEVDREEMLSFLEKIMGPDKARQTVQLVTELTDVYIKADYPQWNRRKRKAKEAERHATTSEKSQTVKYADIIDNTEGIVRADSDFAHVFLYECRDLLKRIDKGNRELYQKAVDLVNEQIGILNERNRPKR